MNMSDYTVLQLSKFRAQDFEAEAKHQEQVRDAKAHKSMLRSLISNKRRK